MRLPDHRAAGGIRAGQAGSVFDHGVMGVSLTGFRAVFWVGPPADSAVLVKLSHPVSGRISVQYYVEPVTGFLLIDTLLSDDKGAFASALSHIVLPAIVLGTVPLAVIARMTRSAMLEVLGEDYIRTARAKGLPGYRVIGLHALRNALIPIVTVIGLQVGVLFTGAILTETIFPYGRRQWLRRSSPRLTGPAGRYIADRRRHVMAVNLLVELTHGLINPRIRHAR
jgi:dipeptide transport system permease protein